jgi:hypothetical protein
MRLVIHKYDTSREHLITPQNQTEIFSQIGIEPVYNSQEEVYAGGSVALELDVTVPPWSGQEEMSFTFQPEQLVVDK